jgi:hypothetical protein
MNSDKIILDLCGGTGAWSKPYKDAGYDVRVVTQPGLDVRCYLPPDDVYGILAAPPCTMFSAARTRAKKPRDLRFGMETVEACLRIIWKAQYDIVPGAQKTRLKFWALENPYYGFLKFFLGKPALVFQPYDYGDRYQKRTSLWGNFRDPKKSPVELKAHEKAKFATNSRALKKRPPGFNPLFNPDGYKKPADMEWRQVQRSITPPVFAEAFFKANR